jgi:heme A synthase
VGTVSGVLTALTAVPLPAAVILFGAGLVALVGLGAGSWRQKKNSLA